MTGASLNAERRAAELEALAAGEPVDLVVVGGGITGAGVALDAASRGLSVALLERRDLAHGTSRWSSKLVHGGLRYLEHRESGLAWESARERALLMGTIAPHLVRPLPFVTPLDGGDAGREGGQDADRAADRRRPADRRPHVAPRAAAGAADQRARGAPARAGAGRGRPARRAAELGRPARGRRAAGRGGRAHRRGARRADPHLRRRDVRARRRRRGARRADRRARSPCGRGTWSSRRASGPASSPRASRCSRAAARTCSCRRAGSATLARRSTCPCRASAAAGCSRCRAPTGSSRSASPTWPPTGRSPTSPHPSAEEEATLLEHASAALEVSLGPEDVAGRYAGLRPLLAGDGVDGRPLAAPRRRRGRGDGRADRRRRQAHDLPGDGPGRRRPHHGPAVPHAPPAAGGRRRRARPRHQAAHAAAGPALARLARRFGAEAAAVAALGSAEPLAPGVPVCEAELRWAAAHELALTPEDLADRRTRAGLVPEWREVVLAAARATIPGCGSVPSPPPTSATSRS